MLRCRFLGLGNQPLILAMVLASRAAQAESGAAIGALDGKEEERASSAAAVDEAPAANNKPQEGEETEAAKLLVGLYWDMGLPLGSTKDWVSGFGVHGFAFDLRYYAFGNWAFGGSLSWNTFDQKEAVTTIVGDATLTGTQVHELSTTPMTGKVFYALRQQEVAIPYLAFGLGGNRVLRRVDAGISRFIEDTWHWTVVPEVGVELPVGKAGSALAAMRFNYLFKTSEAPEQLYLNFSVGFGFK